MKEFVWPPCSHYRSTELGLSPDKIKVIANWADSALITPLPQGESEFRKEWVPGDRFVVCYAGNLGCPHDIATVLSAMALLQERAKKSPSDLAAKIMFVFVGGGVQRARLEREALKRGLTNFRMRPYQPRPWASTAVCDGIGDRSGLRLEGSVASGGSVVS